MDLFKNAKRDAAEARYARKLAEIKQGAVKQAIAKAVAVSNAKQVNPPKKSASLIRGLLVR